MKVNKLALIVTSIALYVMNVKRKSNLCEDNFKHVLLLIFIDVVFVRFSHRRQKYAPPPVVMNTGGVCFHINIDFNYNHRAYRTTHDYHRTAAKTKTISYVSLVPSLLERSFIFV